MLEVGQVIDGKYRVERLLGQGGMGAVFEGYHLLVERRVAIKVLLPQVTASSEGAVRFDREIRAAGRIGNEHILEVFDVGALPDGARYMVSEFLSGETLDARIARAPLHAREIASLMLQLLDGLAAAHQAGIVHRDLKPENIFLLKRKSGQGDFVKIIDFGVSKYKVDEEQALSMTTTGALVGTPYYLSPEQARGERDIDARSDLYTVGVIMFQAVAGRVPVRADTFNELLFKIALEPAPKLSEVVPGVDPGFSALLEKTMARERALRFQSAGDLSAALELWLGGSTQGAVSPVSAVPWSGNVTVESPKTPTSSNFGRTHESTSAFGAKGRRALVLALVGAGLVVLVGVAVAFTRQGGPEPSASGVAPALTQATATEAQPVAPAPAPVVAPVDAPLAEPTPPPNTSAPERAVRVTPPRRTTPAQPRAKGTAQAQVQGTQGTGQVQVQTTQPAPAPAPAPSPTSRGRRDFGY